MVDKEKTDSILGLKVHSALLEAGCETPMIKAEHIDSVDKVAKIEKSVTDIMQVLGLDLEDDSLMRTPHRVGKMLMNELFYGLNYNNFPKVTAFSNKMQFDSMVIERHIKVHSVCEHHLVPIIGEATIAYIPGDKVLGLSKLNRVVDFFCRRPQVQERLGEQIYCALSTILDTENVAVIIRAEHLCVKMRGVQDVNSDTVTTKLGGQFFSGPLRNELYQSLHI